MLWNLTISIFLIIFSCILQYFFEEKLTCDPYKHWFLGSFFGIFTGIAAMIRL